MLLGSYVCYTTNTLDTIEAFIAETYVQLVTTESMCYCYRASWGSAVRCKTRDHMKRITRTAVLDNLPFGAFIAQFSFNSCHI